MGVEGLADRYMCFSYTRCLKKVQVRLGNFLMGQNFQNLRVLALAKCRLADGRGYWEESLIKHRGRDSGFPLWYWEIDKLRLA